MIDAFLSVIVPLRNAGGYVDDLVRSIHQLLSTRFRHFEIVLVDDHSGDDTVERVQALQADVENLQLYCLNRASGIDIAMIAGLDNSIGDFVITLDANQDAPELIIQLWDKTQSGVEVVCGVSRSAQQAGDHSWARRAFHRALQMATGLELPIGLSNLRLYSRRVVSYITLNNDRHYLLKVLPFFASKRVALLYYDTKSRGSGFPRPSLMDSISSGVTILLSSSIRPLRLLTLMALAASCASLLFVAYVLAIAILKRNVVEGWISLALPMAVMFFFISTILGILSEYIYMLSQQSGNRPIYSIDQESASSSRVFRQRLNVVGASGDFATRSTPGKQE